MKKALIVVFVLMMVGCGKDPGLLGKCVRPVEGIEHLTENFCEDYSFETSSSEDLEDKALAAAKAICGSGKWTDDEDCSTLGAAGTCKYSVSKSSGSEKYTLKYNAVYGSAFTGAVDELKTFCESDGEVSGTWDSIYN